MATCRQCCLRNCAAQNTLGSAIEPVRWVSKVTACRRELNIHETAQSREPSYRWARGPTHNEAPVFSQVQVRSARRRTGITWCRSAKSNLPTARESLLSIGLVRLLPPRLPLALVNCCGLKVQLATAGSAEREAPGACHKKLQGLGSPSAVAHRSQRCLTPRSSGAPTAGHQARSVARYILHSPGLASHRRRPLSSNVRQQDAGCRWVSADPAPSAWI